MVNMVKIVFFILLSIMIALWVYAKGFEAGLAYEPPPLIDPQPAIMYEIDPDWSLANYA